MTADDPTAVPVPEAERVPGFVAWLNTRPVTDVVARDALWQLAHCWLDADGEHVWFAHKCRGEWVESMLVHGRPLGWKGNGGGWCANETDPLTVEPSVSCDECGFHSRFIRGAFGFSRWQSLAASPPGVSQ